jgi:hypothetical protein
MAAIEVSYVEFRDAVQVLAKAGEPSLVVSMENTFRKALILGAASYFESVVVKQVEDFVRTVSNEDVLVLGLTQRRVIKRQYHSWFDWDRPNANHFFGMFGEEFAQFMKSKVNADSALEASIRAFMELGAERNRLVHQDFASILVEKTAEDVYSLYERALPFATGIATALIECSAATKEPKKDGN